MLWHRAPRTKPDSTLEPSIDAGVIHPGRTLHEGSDPRRSTKASPTTMPAAVRLWWCRSSIGTGTDPWESSTLPWRVVRWSRGAHGGCRHPQVTVPGTMRTFAPRCRWRHGVPRHRVGTLTHRAMRGIRPMRPVVWWPSSPGRLPSGWPIASPVSSTSCVPHSRYMSWHSGPAPAPADPTGTPRRWCRE